MCKIVAFTNASKLNIKQASQVIGNILLKSERDGFGYSVQGVGGVFGEKCVAPKFSSRLGAENSITLPIVTKRYELFGKPGLVTGPAIFHGRTSTNQRGLNNCHPMKRDGWHLIHNGVVTDHGLPYHKNTTNDSEDLLFRLIEGISEVEKHLTGYYAFGAIDPHGRLHIGLDAIAPLLAAWCPEIDSYIIGTTETLIEEIAKRLKLKIGPIDEIMSDRYLIFVGNNLIHNQAIVPRGWDRKEAKWSGLSLGREIEPIHTSGPEFDEELDEVIESRIAIMDEIDRMDSSYNIVTMDGLEITAREFYKLDMLSQAACTIYRADGTRIDTEEIFGFTG